MNRRKPTLEERLTSCQCCNHPISQRHHLLEVSRYGESKYTYQLCPNCHEIYHIIEAATFGDIEAETYSRATVLLSKMTRVWGGDHPVLKYLTELVKLTGQAKERVHLSFADIDLWEKKIQTKKTVQTLIEVGYKILTPDYAGCECLYCKGVHDNNEELMSKYQALFKRLNLDMDIYYILLPPKDSKAKMFAIPKDDMDWP